MACASCCFCHGVHVNERRILDLLQAAYREAREPLPERNSPLAQALRRAALRIAQEADQDQRQAARTASIVGFSVTRGRTRI